MSAERHIPVLLQEAIAGLCIKQNGIYIDGTFGRGGHTQAILSELKDSGKVFAYDKDRAAADSLSKDLQGDKRFVITHGSFTRMEADLDALGLLGKVDGILLDLGVSSPQLADAERGFSFMVNGPLDMRMDATCGMDAASWLNSASEHEISQVLYANADEPFHQEIAAAIVKMRQHRPLKTTQELCDLILSVVTSSRGFRHPATRTFQAIRIHVNQELTSLTEVLPQCAKLLAVHGRLVTISFHSLEDKIIKSFLRGKKMHGEESLAQTLNQPRMKHVGRAITGRKGDNPRARSAVLRIGERVE